VAEAQTQRLTSEERKSLLIDAAEQTFTTRGYTQAGLAEVATLAGVSKTLLYHYFPEGRPELYREVMDRLLGQVVDALRATAAAPASSGPERQVETLVGSLVAHFAAHPDAYRLLVLEPWGSGDPSVVGQAMAVRNRLAGELNQLLAATGAAAPTIMAGGAAAMGAVLQVCELALAGQVTSEEAVGTARRFVLGGLTALDLL
jgi:AcrR family transcriptional regulator